MLFPLGLGHDAAMILDASKTLADLIALPSVNPMGRPVSGPEYGEARMTAYLQDLFSRLGLPWQRQEVEPGRDNIIARLDGDGPGVLMLEVHQDTVPVDGMTIDPFTPDVRGGRIYGRGACDVKGSMAAMLAALARLVQERPKGMPTILLVCAMNEEFGSAGATALVDLWQPDSQTLFPRRPDAAIVAEPTQLNVVVAHRGILRWKCHVHGRSAHTSQPQLGDNAIYKMCRVIQAFKRYHNDVIPTLPEHPLCGRPCLTVSTITGGVSVNVVPRLCTIEIDRRLSPGEDGPAVYQQILQYVIDNSGVDPQAIEQEPPYRMIAGLSEESNGPLAERLAAVARRVVPDCSLRGVPFGTDAPPISQSGVPTVVFGPGSIDQAHTPDEWLDLDQLERGAEIYYQFCREGWAS